jgi:hypothetical protein
MAQNLVFGTQLDLSGFSAGAQRLLTELEKIRSKFAELGQGQGADVTGAYITATAEKLQGLQAQTEATKARLTELLRLQANAGTGQRTTKASGLEPGAYVGKTKGAGFEAVQAAIAAARRELEGFESTERSILAVEDRRAARLANMLPAAERAALGISKQRLDNENRIADIVSGRARDTVVKEQIRDLAEAKQQALALKEAVISGRISSTPKATAGRLEDELVATERLVGLRAEEKRIVQDLIKTSQELAALPKEEADVERELLNLEKQRLQTAQARNRAAITRAEATQTRGPSLQGALGQGGLDKVVAGIDQVVAKYDAWLVDLESGVGLEAFDKNLNVIAADIDRVIAEITQLENVQNRSDAQIQEQAELYLQLDKSIDQYNSTLEEARARGSKGVGTLDEIDKDFKTGLPRLERTLIGAFEGFGRRFEATLQFAISGALIFGVQRLAREFVQAAIEVERAFADIQTALEFDIAAPRGTNTFAQEVDKVRLKVLQVADEFNLLPTEANKAAFVMVSRFGNVDNALKAVRAQLLATKVSGIDQTEVLRALTAVAEGFAGAMFEVNDSLSIQDKLLRREAISANLYAEALDLAVWIQQKFGIETEDVLEGTARATEVFRIMGFTMEETAALVSAVSRELGQTGVQASEKLVRSIGQLTSPEIRNQLLDLAEASNSFFLTQADFSSGARAWSAIADQFDRIQKAEPGVASTILQIVGQRREAEAVAAALGTIDLQQAIVTGSDEAVGSAEKRYSFLAATVAERIKSIQTAFQELAQNMERLGFLTPLKLLLSVLDGALTLINKIVKAVDSALSALNGVRFGDFGLGDVLKTALSLAIVMRGLVALGVAGVGAGQVLTQFGTKAQAAGGGGASAVALVALGRGLTGMKDKIEEAGGGFASFKVLMQGAVKGVVAAFRGIVPAVTSMVAAFNAARTASFASATSGAAVVGSFLAKVAPWAVAIGVTTVALLDMQRGAKVAAEALKSISAAEYSGITAEREAADLGKTPAEQRVARYEATLRTLTEAFESGEPVLNDWQAATIGWSEALASQPKPQVGPTGVEGAYGLVAGSFANDAAMEAAKQAERESRNKAAQDRERLINEQKQGHTAWWDKLRRDAEYGFLKSSFEVLSERIGAAPRSVINADPEIADQWKELQAKISKAIAAITQAMAEGDPDKVAAFEAELVKLQTESEALFVIFDEFWRGVEGTLTGVRDRIEQAQRDLQLGRTTPEEMIATNDREIGVLREQLKGLGHHSEEEQQRQEILKQIDELDLDNAQLRLQIIDNAIAWADLNRNEIKGLEQKLELLKQKLLVEDISWQEAEDIKKEITATEQQMADALIEGADSDEIKRLEKALSRARNVKEQLVAIANLKAAYKRVIANMLLSVNSLIDLIKFMNNPALYAALDAINDLDFQAADIEKDQKQRLAAANARLGSPIKNRMNQITGELAALNLKLADTPKGTAEYAELLVQIGEKTADKAEEAARIVAAQTLAGAGARNQIGSLTAQLDAAGAELERIAAAYGKNTAEWYEAALALEGIQYALGDAQAELNTLTARLLSDSTDPYQQAIIDWEAAVLAAQTPGLGDLEQAQADWAAQQALDAKNAAEMDDKLFRLKFMYDTDQIGLAGYIAALESMLETIDISTHAGMVAFSEIQSLIDSLTDQVSDMAFNVPTSIRLPTIFEVRRALEADALGVNYQDNRQQDITVYVSDEVDWQRMLTELDDYAGGQINIRSNAYAPGGAGITIGSP